MDSSLIEDTKRFRRYQANLGRQGRPSAATAALTTKIAVYNPASRRNTVRWDIILFCMKIIQAAAASVALKIGAAITLLSSYAENPGAMIRSLINDPDIEVVIVDVADFVGGVPDLQRRGQAADRQQRNFRDLVGNVNIDDAFIHPNVLGTRMEATSRLNNAIASILAQIWILITKAVTAPDTAEESEAKRWAKYVQQRRVDPMYQLTVNWLRVMRELMSRELSVRKYMVEILIDVKRSGGERGRIAEMIADIGNYVEEAGMAGFFLTVKYGVEMRYPFLAYNDFQADLAKVRSLMREYEEIGAKAPYLVLLENAQQTRFAPGNYSLLWSFAMGVGMALDRSMGALNINRTYLEPLYFRLGQELAKARSGTVDKKLAEELRLTDAQIDDLRDLMIELSAGRGEAQQPVREGRFNVAGDLLPDIQEDDDDQLGGVRGQGIPQYQPINRNQAPLPLREVRRPRSADGNRPNAGAQTGHAPDVQDYLNRLGGRINRMRDRQQAQDQAQQDAARARTPTLPSQDVGNPQSNTTRQSGGGLMDNPELRRYLRAEPLPTQIRDERDLLDQ
ncbi:nucleocapsid protein [Ninorex virus]|nr:nucleocapsid protein [Ninorex virus]